MGMAASQARFLGLTARKNNVEFEGQQINQQRTNLANQTANYYNDLLGMKVPTPPSVDNFTKTVYSFNDGALTNQITALIAQSNGDYKVSYLQQHEDDFTPVKDGAAVVTRVTYDDDNDSTTPDVFKEYSIGNTPLRNLGVSVTLGSAEHKNDPYLSKFTTQGEIDAAIAEETGYKNLLEKKYNQGTATDWFVRYVENTTTGEMEPRFYLASEVRHEDEGGNAIYNDANGLSQSSITVYKIGSSTVTEEIKNVDAVLEQDSTGRFINITIDNNGNKVTYSLTTSTITDQAAYDDAMNQYEFDKHQYEQTVQEINAKIEIIQAQDKNLELRLKQLDTEQDAISQEMDAVSSVVQKNVESTFKTFG